MNTELYFRQGFVEKLAERGVSPERLSAALDSVSSIEKSSTWYDRLISGTGNVLSGAGFTALFAPAVVAGIAGYLLNKSKRVSDADLEAKKDIMTVKELEEQRRLLSESN